MKKLLLIVPFLISISFCQISSINATNPNVYNQQMIRLFGNWGFFLADPMFDANSLPSTNIIFRTSANSNDVDATATAMKAATDNGILWIDSPAGTAVMDANVTLTATELLINDPNCYITGTGSPTLTINGTVEAGPERLFDSTITAVVSSKNKINVVWYATSGDGTSGSPWVNALRNAVANSQGYREYIKPAGHYQDTTTIPIAYDGVVVRGPGKRSAIVHYTADDGTAAIQVSSGVVGTEINYCDFSGFRITGDSGGQVATNGIGLELIDVGNSNFEDMAIDFFQNDAKSNLVASGTYKWTASGSGTNEYYLEANAGGDPNIIVVRDVYENSIQISPGTVGSLTAGQWAWADNDSLGYQTVYIRLTDNVDPDTKADGYVQSVLRDGAGIKMKAHFRNNFIDIRWEDNDIAFWADDAGSIHSGQDGDFWKFDKCYFFGRSDFYMIGCLFTTNRMLNPSWKDCIWAGHKYAIYYEESQASTYRNWLIQGGRNELLSDGTRAETFFIHPRTNGLRQLTIKNFETNCRLGSFKNCGFFYLESIKAEDPSASNSLTIDSTCNPVRLMNCEILNGATIGTPLIYKRRGVGLSSVLMEGLWDTVSSGGDFEFGENIKHPMLETDVNLVTVQSYSPAVNQYEIHLVDVTADDAGQTLAIANPTGGYVGAKFTIHIRNSSGGALTNTPTWGNQYYMASGDPTKPANGKLSGVNFECVDTNIYVEVGRVSDAFP